MTRIIALLVALALGCTPIDDHTDPPRSEGFVHVSKRLELTALAIPARVHRVSFSIRGIPANSDEIDRVQADESQLDALADEYLESSHFEDTVKDMFSEILLTRGDSGALLGLFGDLTPTAFPDASWSAERLRTFGSIALAKDIGEGPLALIAEIATATPNRPFSEILTADHTYVGRVSHKAWAIGSAYDADQPDAFQSASYTDGRPNAGILSDPAILMRWFSQGGNAQRGRANLVADAFLCASFAERDVSLPTDIDFGDATAVSDAVMADESCVACHQGLDPIGAVFWPYVGYFTPNSIKTAYETGRCGQNGVDLCYPLDTYDERPQAADRWRQLGLRSPAYYGRPIQTTADLGQEIAADPRFSRCMARRVYGYVAQIEPEDVPADVAYDLQKVFIESNQSFKALYKAAVLNPRNLAKAVDEHQGPDIGRRALRAEFFVRTLRHLTAFDFGIAILQNCTGERADRCPGYTDLAFDAGFGLRALLGGTDAVRVLKPVFPTTVTKVLAMNTLAQLAAAQLYHRETTLGAEAKFFGAWDGTDGTVDAQISALWRSVLGVSIDDNAAQSLRQVYDELRQLADDTGRDRPEDDAWIGVLAAIIQDPSLTLY